MSARRSFQHGVTPIHRVPTRKRLRLRAMGESGVTQPRTDPRCRDCHVPVEPRQRLCCQCRRLARRKTHRIFMRRWRAKKAGEQSCGVTDAMLGYTGVSAQTARAVMFGPRGGWLKKGEAE